TAELQPDYFSYSLLNNSGRFIRDNLKEAHTIPKDDVKIWDVVIQSNPLPIQQRLTDKKGIDYYFSSYLQDHSPGTESSSFMPRERYSYKIDSIVIPNSGTVKFEYYEVSYEYISSRSSTKKILLKNNTFVEQPLGTFETISTITENLPKSVSYKNTIVNFKYKMNDGNFLGRLDVNEGGESSISKKGAILEFIEVLNVNNNAKIKEFKLFTNYFNNNGGVLLKRLKLDKIENTIEETFYEFNYIGEDNNQFLPSRFSYSQDYWGMYNGKNNTTSVPDYLHEVGQKGIYFPGANKYPDKDFAVIGSLKKIKLPTGGYQVFEYELDQFRNTDFTNDYEYLPVHNFQKMNFQIIAGDSHDF